MYLKRLDMLGFKSFATRTLLEFSPGITAVIGPNGAGKSNVADAMRWVLGEQSMRQLRGKKSDDIIFAGASGRSALGMAEVSLTLDNSTGWVPSDYSEITVTRRSFRSGENEYLINKQKVRLKDVLLLLAQARIGHDSYTVVGQGSIDAALSLRAEERRGLFEDAAGIRPFQVQRADAENRLRQTEQNLERLRDIVSEIEPRLAPLAEQAQRAVEYTRLNNELQEVLSTWYALQWRRLHSSQERAEQAEQEQTLHVRQLEQSVHELQEQGHTLRAKRQHIQLRISTARQSYNDANSSMQKSERDLAISQERVVSLEQQRGDIQQEERRLRERGIVAQKKTIDLEEQCDAADEAVDSESAALATLEVQVSKAQNEYEMEERRLRTAQNDLIQIQARLGSSQTELGRVQKQLGERNRTLASRRDTIAQAQQSLRTIETRLVEERANLSTARNEEQQVTQHKQSLGRAIADAQQEVERLKATLAESERQKRTITDRLNMLKNWRQSLSGYSDGVRNLLRAPTGKITGLLGPVPQLGVAPSGMEAALETAFGPYMQAVVVKNLDDAYRALTFLQGSGKAMVVWLEREDDASNETILSIQGQEEEVVLQRFLAEKPMLHDSIIGFAWRHIQCDAPYTALFRRILRGIVIAHTVEAAHALLAWALPLSLASGSDLPFTSIITLKGEMLHSDGWLTSGGTDSGQQGLLAHERELHELPQQVEQQKSRIDQINGMLSEVQRAQEGRRIEQSAVEKELQKLTGRINDLHRIVNTSQRELERTNTEIQLAASVEQQLAAEVAGLEQEVVAAQQRVKAHEKSQREMAGRAEELQYEMEERAITYRRQQDDLGRVRTSVAVQRQEAKALQQQLAVQRTQAQELKSMIEQQVARRKDTELRQQVLQETFTLQRLELEQARTQSHTLSEALRAIEGELTQVDQHITVSEQRRMQVQQRMTEQETLYRRALLESQRARDAVTTLLEQLREEMGIDDPQALATYESRNITTPSDNGATNSIDNSVLSEEEETQLRRLRRRVDVLRSRLKAMGGYDSMAPQLYEETRTRFEFLSTQITDMGQAALQLHAIINQLDGTMARQFEVTFQAINVRFREHFTTLFNGGTARLELVTAKSDDEERPTSSAMPSGVDVIVQPPGKKVQDLSLLSGGERALVSAALLFALLEINPPPFCLLDEVDAALDESNVTRFCDILKRLAQRTQFIMITHNRVTMTAAQVLYGVSMRESVSRLLSMRIEEAVVAGDR
ncbi:MAG: chromosome segregation protein SMC [Ktedonobacteraceae bacterium]